MEPIFVSIAEAQRMLGLGKTSLYSLIAEKKLETKQIGRRRLVLVSSLRQFAEAA